MKGLADIPFKEGDLHLYVNGKDNTQKVFRIKDGKGVPVPVNGREVFPAFPHGVNGTDQTRQGNDAPEGIYILEAPIYTGANEPDEIKRAYGRVFVPMRMWKGKSFGRLGFGVHGGGHWGQHWDDFQPLTYTLGCDRTHNKDAESVAWLQKDCTARGCTFYMTLDHVGGVGLV